MFRDGPVSEPLMRWLFSITGSLLVVCDDVNFLHAGEIAYYRMHSTLGG